MECVGLGVGGVTAVLGPPDVLFEEPLAHPGPPYERVYLTNVEANIPKLSDAVDGAFDALRQRVVADCAATFSVASAKPYER